jgi:hypothetical protein
MIDAEIQVGKAPGFARAGTINDDNGHPMTIYSHNLAIPHNMPVFHGPLFTVGQPFELSLSSAWLHRRETFPPLVRTHVSRLFKVGKGTIRTRKIRSNHRYAQLVTRETPTRPTIFSHYFFRSGRNQRRRIVASVRNRDHHRARMAEGRSGYGTNLYGHVVVCRPTELAMISESDIDLEERRLTSRNAKAGNDI